MILSIGVIVLKLKNILKSERKRHHFTQAQLSERLHVSRKTISDWENGRSIPNVDILLSLSNIYEIPINLFLRSQKPCKELIISYYLNIVLLLLSYLDLFGIATRIIPIIMIINLIFLKKLLKKQNRMYFNNKFIVLISFLFMIINIVIGLITHHINLFVINLGSMKQLGILISIIIIVLIRLISFFYLLELSRYL